MVAPRTLLVGLAAADGDPQTFLDPLDVGEAQRHQLGTPKGAGHAEGQQRPVAHGAQVVADDGAQHVAQDVGVGRVLLDAGDTVATPDAGDHLEDGRSALNLLRRLEAGTTVHPSDRRQAPPDGERG